MRSCCISVRCCWLSARRCWLSARASWLSARSLTAASCFASSSTVRVSSANWPATLAMSSWVVTLAGVYAESSNPGFSPGEHLSTSRSEPTGVGVLQRPHKPKLKGLEHAAQKDQHDGLKSLWGQCLELFLVRESPAKARLSACLLGSGRWGSNPRHLAWEASALPTELRPRALDSSRLERFGLQAGRHINATSFTETGNAPKVASTRYMCHVSQANRTVLADGGADGGLSRC